MPETSTPEPEIVTEYETMMYKRRGKIAYIMLNRPQALNAVNDQFEDDLHSALLEYDLDDEAWVAIIHGAGRSFCAGADINMMRDAGARSVEENRADSERLDRLFNGIWAHPCFTIGCIQGVALGGGAGLVSCFDYAIAEPKTRIALSEAKLGILPAVIGPYVYRRVGSSNFR